MITNNHKLKLLFRFLSAASHQICFLVFFSRIQVVKQTERHHQNKVSQDLFLQKKKTSSFYSLKNRLQLWDKNMTPVSDKDKDKSTVIFMY